MSRSRCRKIASTQAPRCCRASFPAAPWNVALPHSLRAPNVGLEAASHLLSIQSSLANKRATAPVCRLRDSGTDRFARHNAIANQSEVGGIVFFYRARLTPCPYYLRSSIRELKPFSSTAKRRGGVRSNYVARGRSWGLVFSKQSSPVSIASSIAGGLVSAAVSTRSYQSACAAHRFAVAQSVRHPNRTAQHTDPGGF